MPVRGTPEPAWCGGPFSQVLGGAAFLGLDLVVLQGALDQCLLLGSRVDWLPSPWRPVIHRLREHAPGRGSWFAHCRKAGLGG